MAKLKTNLPKNVKDPFFEELGKYLGVPADKIRIEQSGSSGRIKCIGPRPKSKKAVPNLPRVRNYCFTFVIKLPPPLTVCNALRQEYDQLRRQLRALIAAQAWDEVAAVARRLSELATAIRNICQVRERVITYCVFPKDFFDDPFVDERVLPPLPPVPPY